MTPTQDQAYQFALMLMTGVPASEAVQYFLPDDLVVEADYPLKLAREWAKSKAVAQELVKLQKGEWTALTPQQRIQLALDKHYNEMAYFLYTHNYAEEHNPANKSKADTCRMALEAKLAGMAGKMNELATFWSDLMAGRVKVPQGGRNAVATGN